MLTAILIVSIALQFTAAFLAIRLIAVTGRRLGWIAISAAMTLMAIRRSITLFRQLSGAAAITADPAAELVALAISILMVGGLLWIGPMFRMIRDSERRLWKSHRAMRALSQCNQAVIRASSETEMVDSVCRVIVEAAGYRLAWVGFAEDDERKSVRPVAQHGFEKGYLDKIQITWSDDDHGRGPTGTAIRTGEPSISRHILTDPNFEPWRAAALERGYASSIALPLVINAETLGALNIYAVEPDAFNEDELRLLEEMSSDLSYGIGALRTRQKHERGQEEILRLKEFNEDIVQNLIAGIVVQDADLNLQFVNPSAAGMLGYSPEELEGQPWQTIVPEDQHPIVEAADTRRTRGEADQYELELLRKDGSKVPVLVSGRPRFENGRFAGALVVYTDLSERKRAEQALAESQRRLTTLMGNLPGMAYRCRNDRDWTMEFVSEGALELTGYAPEDLVLNRKTSYAELIVPEDREPVWEGIQTALAAHSPFRLNYRIRTRQGAERWVWEQGSGIFEDGDVLALEGFITDITERVRVEEQLQRILDTVQEGLVALDGEKRVVLANPAGHEYLAILSDERAGETITQLGPRPISELLAPQPEPLPHEITLAGPLQRIFEVHVTPAKPVEGEGGWTLLVREVTETRQVRRRAELQERLAAVGRLAAGIAHDFNNIMATIMLYSDIMLRAGDLKEKDIERTTTIGEQAKQATSLTQQILDFGRRTVMQPHPMDLVPFLKDFEKLLSRTVPENIQMAFPSVEGEYIVNADPGRLQQVLMNLALNARDAMGQGGELQVELAKVRVKPGERPPYRDMRVGEWVWLKVSDTGTGIPADVLPRVFEPFFTTKEPGEGTGLGLAQVYGIIKQHGGYIDVESQIGEGSTFSIYLPAHKVPMKTSISTKEAVAEKGRGETILVVEDEVAMLEAVVTTLESLGYRVLAATDGREALGIYEQHAETIDLVVADLVMPVMGGRELYQTLKEDYPKLKMVLVTGYPLGEGTRELLEQQRVTWVQKPIDVEKLARVVRSSIE